jgi:hypothetical protein
MKPVRIEDSAPPRKPAKFWLLAAEVQYACGVTAVTRIHLQVMPELHEEHRDRDAGNGRDGTVAIGCKGRECGGGRQPQDQR